MTGVVVVTGAGRGIGAATARAVARTGRPVCVNYRTDATAAAAVVATIRAGGGTAEAVAADVGVAEDVERLFAAADRMGPLAGLVNNAGIAGPRCRLDALAPDDLRAVLATNVVGAFLCARAAVRRLSTRHGGRGGAIVNLSSQTARFGGVLLTPYAASKAAVEAMTVGLAREVAGEGIRVNAVSPGVIDTDQQAALPPERRAEVAASLPMGRMGTPEEVA
jgi:NAD(P)-dependent dehydrogenase (short-subunit alcohol dehydrogenase family)